MTARGYRPFWPELEAKPKRGWCNACRAGTLRNHATSRRHLFATRPRVYARGSGDWLKPRHYFREKTDADYDAEERELMLV